ncbi:MAG: hypothetical protein JSS82_00090 [Bacteroidetes bacterium]|nr:hypothetical protein [Bacteroidota bacterium]
MSKRISFNPTIVGKVTEDTPSPLPVLPRTITEVLKYELQRANGVAKFLAETDIDGLDWTVFSACLEGCVLGVVNATQLITENFQLRDEQGKPSRKSGFLWNGVNSDDPNVSEAFSKAKKILSTPLKFAGHSDLPLWLPEDIEDLTWMDVLQRAIHCSKGRLDPEDRVTIYCIPTFLETIDDALVALRGSVIPDLAVGEDMNIYHCYELITDV